MIDIDWKGLALPFAYVLVLGSALMTFSTIYRKRKAGKSLLPQFEVGSLANTAVHSPER